MADNMRRAWVIKPGRRPSQTVEKIDVPAGKEIEAAHRHITTGTLDFCRVLWEGKFRSMVVDDLGHAKYLELNEIATEAYLGACKPDTRHAIRGPVIIFEGELR